MVLRGRKARDETVTVDGSLHEAAKSYVCASHWSPSWQQCNAVVSSPYGSLILRRPRLFCPTCEASAQSIAAFPREDGSPALVQFGAALGAAPSCFCLVGMFLLDLLRLLSVALFHLLFLSVVVVFRGGLLMFFFLLLLELLVVLRLLGS